MPIGLDIKRIPQKNLVINGYQIPAGVITSVKDNVMLFFENRVCKICIMYMLFCLVVQGTDF